jgi:bifunctional DNase/RNase
MKVKMKLLGLTFSQVQTGAYAIILAEESGDRRVPVIIGTPEAQAIAIWLDELKPPRPLTHDLFVAFIEAVKVKLEEVFIHDFKDGVFFSMMIFRLDDREIRLDARTSDAVTLAVRLNAQITIDEGVLKETGINLDEADFLDEIAEREDSQELTADKMNIEDLQESLREAIEAENYEEASYLRDLIKKKTDQ